MIGIYVCVHCLYSLVNHYLYWLYHYLYWLRNFRLGFVVIWNLNLRLKECKFKIKTDLILTKYIFFSQTILPLIFTTIWFFYFLSVRSFPLIITILCSWCLMFSVLYLIHSGHPEWNKSKVIRGNRWSKWPWRERWGTSSCLVIESILYEQHLFHIENSESHSVKASGIVLKYVTMLMKLILIL